MQSWIFSIITPAFSVTCNIQSITWSFRNHSNILIYYECWKQFCCLIYLMNKRLKRTAFIQNKKKNSNNIYSNNIFSLLSLFINLTHPCWIKVLILFKKKKEKKLLTPNYWPVVYIVITKYLYFKNIAFFFYFLFIKVS